MQRSCADVSLSDIPSQMIEILSLVACGLIVLLVISMLIPTGRRAAAAESSDAEDLGISTEITDLIFRLSIDSWRSRNTLKRTAEIETTAESTVNQLLYEKLAEVAMSSWIDPKSKLLTRQSLCNFCRPDFSDEQTRWCITAVWGGPVEKSDSFTDLQKELLWREISSTWSKTLSKYGLVAADENEFLWLAIPYLDCAGDAANIAVAISLYEAFNGHKFHVNDTECSTSCRIRLADIGSTDNVDQRVTFVSDTDLGGAPIYHFDGQQWHAIDPKAHTSQPQPNKTVPTSQGKPKDATIAELTQLLTDGNAKPAVMCMPDKPDLLVDIPEAAADDIANALENDRSNAADPELSKIEASIQDDIRAIEKDVATAKVSAPEAQEVDPQLPVTSDDIAKLFAAARSGG